jgi:GH43 family beta-xylosidase
MEYNLVRHGNQLLEIIRDFNPSNFITDSEGRQMNKELLGMWVNHLEGDSVVQKNGKILICRQVEDAIIE